MDYGLTASAYRQHLSESTNRPPPYSRIMAASGPTSRVNTDMGSSGYMSDDEPTGDDPSTSTGLLQERLQAWKHICGYFENYINEVAKVQKSSGKDQDKLLKSLSNPIKEQHHFDTALGGVTGLVENLRSNTQTQSNLYTETNSNLTGQVLPILERLHKEIKNKSKELQGGAGKASKSVDAARSTSQKHIESLGHHTAAFDSSGGKVSAQNDPYILQRGVYHRLNRQILEENNNKSDIVAVQNSFQQFESHVVTTLQTALQSFNQFMGNQCERQKAMYGDTATTASNIPLDFEWNGFVKRNSNNLVNPNAPNRSMSGITFPNQNHRATKALIEGSLERKGRGMGALSSYKSAYYSITPSGYLHEFKDNDNYQSDPTPVVSLYLPDSTTGAVDGTKFSIKGKDSSGNKIAQKMAIGSDFQFKAHTASDAEQWHRIIAEQTTGVHSTPTSPTESRNVTPIATRTEQQTSPQGMQQEKPYPQQQEQATLASRPGNDVPQRANTASPTSPGMSGGADDKYYHGTPAQNQLGDREYVSKQ